MRRYEDTLWVKIEASKLSLDDAFLKHMPRTEKEEAFKEQLISVIQKGVETFYRPKLDPFVNQLDVILPRFIDYSKGRKPAVGEYFGWWYISAKRYSPTILKTRLGTKSEYIAFLGFLIKEMIKDGWSVEEAWNSVCNDSKRLGRYRDTTPKPRYDAGNEVELTGTQGICGFFDLGNTYKIVIEDEGNPKCWLAGGNYTLNGNESPLANLQRYDLEEGRIRLGVGWLVF